MAASFVYGNIVCMYQHPQQMGEHLTVSLWEIRNQIYIDFYERNEGKQATKPKLTTVRPRTCGCASSRWNASIKQLWNENQGTMDHIKISYIYTAWQQLLDNKELKNCHAFQTCRRCRKYKALTIWDFFAVPHIYSTDRQRANRRQNGNKSSC